MKNTLLELILDILGGCLLWGSMIGVLYAAILICG